MDGDLAEKIRTLLADPEASSKIAAAMQTLQMPSAPKPAPTVTKEPEAAVAASLPTQSSQNRHAQLMTALRSLVREDKRSKIDSRERAMTVATLFAGFRKGRQL